MKFWNAKRIGLNLSRIPESAFAELFLNNTPLIDVRAPVEFLAGSLPGAVNLPIMNDQERAAVGTTYKQQGREAAIELGHQLVSGANKDQRVEQWCEYIRKHPEAVIYCFRGGLRSQISQRWISESGLSRPLIQGGYKAVRHFLMKHIDEFSQNHRFLMISGPTGSAKTHLLSELQSVRGCVDLEKHAGHRGSAFGGVLGAQPTQIDFENHLAVALLKIEASKESRMILVEDESRMIGRCVVPEGFFTRMRESELVYIDEPIEKRVQNIFNDYISATPIVSGTAREALNVYHHYRQALLQISRKLGGARTQEILADLDSAAQVSLSDSRDFESNKIWIEKLLRYYYDPQYAKSLERRNSNIHWRGSYQSALEYLKG